MYDIVTLGSSSIDIFVTTEAKKTKSLLCYPVGGKILIQDIKFMTGGGGLNTAIAFSKLKLKTACLGKLGNDTKPDLILKRLKKEKIDFLGVKGSGITGHSIILDSHKINDRTILTYKGINNNLNYNEIKKVKTKWFYFSSMLGKSFDSQKKLAEYASKNNIKIAYNISIYLAKKGINHIRPILKRCSIFISNKEEILALTKMKDIIKAMKKVYLINNSLVCVTDGANKLYLYDGYYIYSLKPHKVKIKEKTGAGDAFASGLVAALIKNKGIEQSLNIALLNSEAVIRGLGANNNLLTWNELIKLYKNNKVKVYKKRY